MKAEVIARQHAGDNEARFRYALVTLTDALRILEQAGYVVVPKEPTEEMRRLERERDRWKEDCLALARPGRIVPPHGSGP